MTDVYTQDGHKYCKKCDGLVCDHRDTEYLEDKKVHVCKECGKAFRKPEVYARVCGYLRPVSQFNLGKKEEFAYRKNFKGIEHAR